MLTGMTRPPTKEEFFRLGLDDTAYIKVIQIAGQRVHAIYAADGTPLAMVPERDTAFATVRQNEMEPTSVH